MTRVPLALALLLPFALSAQSAPPPDTTRSVRDSAIKVFVDCPDFSNGCDISFFRTEITYVNYTQNPQDADVHILITTQPTGGGGTEYTITLIGQHRFSGKADTLRYNGPPAQSADDARNGVKGQMELGLASYAATTPLASRMHVTYDAPLGAAAVVHDPWNYWVFTASVNGNLFGQESSHSGFASVSFSGNRVTEKWKIMTNLNYNYNQSDYRVPNTYDSLGNTLTTIVVNALTRGYNFNALVVRSAGAHWGIGGRASLSAATYNNETLFGRVAPAVEYDFFPYSQSTRQLVTLHYEIGAARYDYQHLTLYGKYHEYLFDQTLTLLANAKEPWGTVNASIEGASYLHDLSKHHFTFFTSTQLNLYRGLSFSVSGSLTLQHDQLFLAAGGASVQDILLQQRALATGFTYFAFFGLNFHFGSIFNNVVNPRFGDSGGGMMIMM